MIEDEITWLHNFSPCNPISDSQLLAGHIRLVKALLSCQGVGKVQVGDYFWCRQLVAWVKVKVESSLIY